MSMSIAHPAQVPHKNLFHWPRLAQACPSAGCTRHEKFWTRWFLRETAIKFQLSSLCFPDCFERELRRELERLSATNHANSVRTSRIPIGLLMLSRGDLTSEQLWRALQEQKQAGFGRIGEWFT